MEHKIREDGDVIILEISGDVIGIPDATALNNLTHEFIDQNKIKVIFDLAGVVLMNSSGLGILISALTSVRKAGGDIVFINISDRIKNILEITKLDSIFRIFENKESAMKHFK
ncbi:STAS domain-containing protein [candidate division KSB1 bacterium]